MKSLRRMVRLAALALVLALGGSQASAQSFYSLQHTNWPPLPFLPFEVTLYDFGDGIFAYDDLAVDYDQLRAARRQALLGDESGPPWPEEGEGGEGGGGGPQAYNYSTNDLWVEMCW